MDRLDPGIAKRPSRFDRKYLFPLPSFNERGQYCNYWRLKLRDNPDIEFPKRLCTAIANITEDFSFAYLKEAFVAALLVLAVGKKDESVAAGGADGAGGGSDDDDEDLKKLALWREIRKQIKSLREEMGGDEDDA